MMAKVQKTNRKKIKRDVAELGKAVVTSTFNNTIVTITNLEGDALVTGSCGMVGFKGSRRSTPYAATVAATEIAKKAVEMGVRRVSVFIKGPGSGRDSAVKALRAAGLQIISLSDITPIPHNGCRSKNRRKP